MSIDSMSTRIVEPEVTIIVVTWNAEADITGCLVSMFNQTYPNFKVLVIDSNSTDSTLKIIEERFPSVQIIRSKENLGYLRGNRLGMGKARGDYVVVCNDDVIVENRWLEGMVKVMESDHRIGMVTPCILMYGQPNVLNAAGNTLHFSGLYGPRGKNAPVQLFSRSEDVSAVSGCCFMIRRSLMVEANGFSLDFDRVPRFWHSTYEDVDLSWHIQMMGYRIRYVSDSIMYHKYTQPSQDNWNRFTQRCYTHLLFVLRNFDLSALILLAPVISIIEISWLLYGILKGKKWAIAKLKAWDWFLSHRKDLLQMRRSLKPLRRKSYWKIFPKMSPTIDLSQTYGGLVGRIGSSFLNSFFWSYYQMIRICSGRI